MYFDHTYSLQLPSIPSPGRLHFLLLTSCPLFNLLSLTSAAHLCSYMGVGATGAGATLLKKNVSPFPISH